jgi:hypothetical protein
MTSKAAWTSGRGNAAVLADNKGPVGSTWAVDTQAGSSLSSVTLLDPGPRLATQALGFVLAAAFLVTAAPANAQTLQAGRPLNGSLAQGDQTLTAGEFVDRYSFQGSAGQRIGIDMSSGQFDAYLMLRGPGNTSIDNDDGQPGTSLDARIEATLPVTGTYSIAATSVNARETGSYRLTITNLSSAAGPSPARSQSGQTRQNQPGSGNAGSQGASMGQLVLGRPVSGTLASGDATLQSGEFADLYRVTLPPGRFYEFRLESGAFDAYLMIGNGIGGGFFNDDDPDATGTNSKVVLSSGDTGGTLTVTATSLNPRETGAYRLSFREISQADASRTAQANRGAGPDPSGNVRQNGNTGARNPAACSAAIRRINEAITRYDSIMAQWNREVDSVNRNNSPIGVAVLAYDFAYRGRFTAQISTVDESLQALRANNCSATSISETENRLGRMRNDQSSILD